jgi:hypothetical protein
MAGMLQLERFCLIKSTRLARASRHRTVIKPGADNENKLV